MKATIKQKCPCCDEMLYYEVSTVADVPNERGGVDVTVHAKTTPESTAHVWTHAPKEDS